MVVWQRRSRFDFLYRFLDYPISPNGATLGTRDFGSKGEQECGLQSLAAE